MVSDPAAIYWPVQHEAAFFEMRPFFLKKCYFFGGTTVCSKFQIFCMFLSEYLRLMRPASKTIVYMYRLSQGRQK